MASEKYTTIALLTDLMGERHAINCAVERSGAVIGDADVIARIEGIIAAVSRELDGYLQGHTDVPFAEIDVPESVEVLVRGYSAYRMWTRRGRFDKNNPHYDEKVLFFKRVNDIQNGRWKFETVDGDEVAEKPSLYETDRVSDDIGRKKAGRQFTDTSLKGFTNPQ